jgi:hypothetical protein
VRPLVAQLGVASLLEQHGHIAAGKPGR